MVTTPHFVLVALLLACASVVTPARAQATDPPTASGALNPGHTAVSGFSGAVLSADSLAPGVDPIDKTVIDVNGASLRVFDLSTLGAPLAGQIINPPVTFDVKAKDIGQVFGLALDDGTRAGSTPNLYAGATSTFGIQIVGSQPDSEGKPIRLKIGAPGARFMDGQFGSLPGGGPGTIWKIDGTTGRPSVFASTDLNRTENSGPGLGGLAYDPKTRSLYASDLDTGLIHRFAIEGGGASAAQFDHGHAGRAAAGRSVAPDDGKRMDVTHSTFKPDDPSTWGLTQAERRVDGLAVHNGRLYYAVAEGPEIWSVGLNADGSFGSDTRLETPVRSERPAVVTAIVFDGSGRMLIALRGMVRNAFDFGQFIDRNSGEVRLFDPKQPGVSDPGGLWLAELRSLPVGSGAGNRSASGGLSLQHAYTPDGTIDLATCNATLIATGDALVAPALAGAATHGLQLNSIDRTGAVSGPPNQSAFVDFDGPQGDPDALGHIGAVVAFQRCDGPVAAQVVASGSQPPVQGAPLDAGAAWPPVQGALMDAGAGQSRLDQGAGNIAVAKTQNCRLATPDMAECDYTITATNTGATGVNRPITIEDAFSVAPDHVTLPDGGVGVERTAAGFQLNFLPDIAQRELAFKATFRVPPGGLTVENCASLSLAAAGPQGPAVDPTAAAGRSVRIVSGPTCVPNADGLTQGCVWDVDFLNQSEASAPVVFTFTTSQPVQPGTGIGGPSGTVLTLVDELTTLVKGPDIAPRENKISRLVATFPLNAPPPSATVALDAVASGATLGQGAQPDPAVAPMADANPADDTSCVKWHSNNPDDQGTPTNTPTEPQAGDPGRAPADPNAPNLAISKTQSCRLENANRARCTYQIAVTNTGQTPFQFAGGAVIEDTFSIRPADFVVNAAGAERTATGFRVPENRTRVFAPGESDTFPPFDATFTVPPGGLKVENCANLTLPPGGTPIPAVLTPIDDLLDGTTPSTATGLDKSVAMTGEPVCISRGAVKDCSWKVTVSNTGTVPFPFGFEFTTAEANTEVSALGGLTPSRRDSQKTIFERGPVMLPGTSKTLTVQATLPAGASPASADGRDGPRSLSGQ